MAIIVPTPTVPPRINPRLTKKASHPIRIQRNSIRSSLSERMMATRSFGPVPALLLITTDIPKERIAHPTRTLMIRTGIPEEALMYSLKHQVKKSMIGPPQNAQTMVPGLTYPLVVNNIRTIKIHRTMTCTVPTGNPATRDNP